MSIGCNKISIQYKNQTFIRDIHLVLPERKITLLYGPSGSGKTTLLNILAGLILPPKIHSGGKVFWYDETIKDLKKRRELLKALVKPYGTVDGQRSRQVVVSQKSRRMDYERLLSEHPLTVRTLKEQKILFEQENTAPFKSLMA